MKILNYGSLNVDHVYGVDHFIRPKETMSSNSYNVFLGGKGLNQSIALARAGANIYHAGKVGKDGDNLVGALKKSGANTDFISKTAFESGHTVIQVDSQGQNCIILHGGANQQIKADEIASVLENFEKGDYLLLQNEINNTALIMTLAKEKGLNIVLNPAPMNEKIEALPLELVDVFVVNELEGEELTGEKDELKIIEKCLERFENSHIILTLGEKGVYYADKNQTIFQPAFKVENVLDTTAAGDTFIGYYLSEKIKGTGTDMCLKIACKASSICVAKNGACDSIPHHTEVSL
jgi:ribokinase